MKRSLGRNVLRVITLTLAFMLLLNVDVYASRAHFSQSAGTAATFSGSVHVFRPAGQPYNRRIVNASTIFASGNAAFNNTNASVQLTVLDAVTGRQLFFRSNNATWRLPMSEAFTEVHSGVLTASNGTRGVRANTVHRVTGPVSFSRNLSTSF